MCLLFSSVRFGSQLYSFFFALCTRCTFVVLHTISYIKSIVLSLWFCVCCCCCCCFVLFLFLLHFIRLHRCAHILWLIMFARTHIRSYIHAHASLTTHETALKLLDWDLFTYKRKSNLRLRTMYCIELMCVCVLSVSSPSAFFRLFRCLHKSSFSSSLSLSSNATKTSKIVIIKTTRMQNASEAKAERNVNVNRGS